jgi:proteic killer suppression protein
MLHGARPLADLNNPPGNRLEALRGDRKGQHSVHINDQYRLCFVWKEPYAYEIEIADYY